MINVNGVICMPILKITVGTNVSITSANTYEKEAMAILEATKKWKNYFASTSIIISRNENGSDTNGYMRIRTEIVMFSRIEFEYE